MRFISWNNTALLYPSNYLRIGFTLKLFFSLLIISTFLTFLILLHFLQGYKSEFFSWISHPHLPIQVLSDKNIQIRTDLKFSEFRKFRVKLSRYLKDLLLKTKETRIMIIHKYILIILFVAKIASKTYWEFTRFHWKSCLKENV